MYEIHDVNGFMSDFATVDELKRFSAFISKSPNLTVRKFLDKGAAIVEEGLCLEIDDLKSLDDGIQNTILNLQEIVEDADTMIILVRK